MEIIFAVSAFVFFLMFVFVVINTILISGYALLRKKTVAKGPLPGVSVLIPAYNEEKNIRETLAALVTSDYPKNKLDIIVIDDGSTDKTIEIVKGFESVRLVRQKHKGKSEALNAAVKISKFDFILTIDADTVLRKNAIREVIKPFSDKKVGAVNGVLGIKKRNSLLNVFQEVEFLYLSLTMEAYSYFFKKPLKIWGAFVCYRKNVIKKAGGFEKTYTEDFEILMQMTKLGYRTATTGEAFGFTSGQKTVDEFFEQRNRWYMGNLQSLAKARRSLYLSAFSIFIIFYFVVSLPLFIYHIAYWIPQNSATAFDLIFYFVRWFTITGPVYMIYMIPQWGINLTYIFGVISGILSFILTIWALKRYNQTDFRRILATTIYFPYTLFLSVIAFVSLLTFRPSKKAYFIRK